VLSWLQAALVVDASTDAQQKSIVPELPAIPGPHVSVGLPCVGKAEPVQEYSFALPVQDDAELAEQLPLAASTAPLVQQ
jgi:hypothetical protein